MLELERLTGLLIKGVAALLSASNQHLRLLICSLLLRYWLLPRELIYHILTLIESLLISALSPWCCFMVRLLEWFLHHDVLSIQVRFGSPILWGHLHELIAINPLKLLSLLLLGCFGCGSLSFARSFVHKDLLLGDLSLLLEEGGRSVLLGPLGVMSLLLRGRVNESSGVTTVY